MSSWDTSVGSRATHPPFPESQFSHLVKWDNGLEQCQARSRRWERGWGGGSSCPSPAGLQLWMLWASLRWPMAATTHGEVSGLETRWLSCGSGGLKPKSAMGRAGSFWRRRGAALHCFFWFWKCLVPWLMAPPRSCWSAAQFGPRARSPTSAAFVPPLTLTLLPPSRPPGTLWRHGVRLGSPGNSPTSRFLTKSHLQGSFRCAREQSRFQGVGRGRLGAVAVLTTRFPGPPSEPVGESRSLLEGARPRP